MAKKNSVEFDRRWHTEHCFCWGTPRCRLHAKQRTFRYSVLLYIYRYIYIPIYIIILNIYLKRYIFQSLGMFDLCKTRLKTKPIKQKAQVNDLITRETDLVSFLIVRGGSESRTSWCLLIARRYGTGFRPFFREYLQMDQRQSLLQLIAIAIA